MAEAPNEVGSELLLRLRLLESVVVNSHDAILITEAEPIDDPGPTIQYVNPAFTRMTGYAPEDVLGKSPRLLQGPLSDGEVRTKIRAALKSWSSIEVEVLNYRKNGSTFWVELSISPVCDETGWFTHWVSIQRDVTERKRNEKAAVLLQAAALQNIALTEQIQERRLSEAALSHVAFHDSLTGLRNRIYFSDRLEIALKQAKGGRGYAAAVIFLDLDGFKEINDTLGHRAGDLFLIEIAKRLEGCARTQDTVARLGGDEFAILLDNLKNVGQALEVAERILTALSLPVLLSGGNSRVNASLGLCGVTDTYSSAEEIMRDADTAMYRSKRQGGGQYVVFDDSMQEAALLALRTTWEIRIALELSQFELYYQPLVSLEDGSIYGVEALIRWNHPIRGLLGPDEFIGVAEEIGLIGAIGSWIAKQAMDDIKSLSKACGIDLLLSVNVSSRQLEDDDFLPNLLETLHQQAMEPSLLQLEITESIYLKDAQRVGTLIRDLRAFGIKIAFDDFGTGYSSISYLERYPVDMIKIDQWFVQHLNEGSVNVQVVQMMIQLAAVFGMGVSAEGVENAEQATALKDAGCLLAQGHLYGRAVPLGEMVRSLQATVAY
jgi:diguanylate cyclase (GGDEF)-like protein/PAS domain S-box-containing protein